ncbi:MAG: ERCC4 domain-containing protein [Bacillota bacterium]
MNVVKVIADLHEQESGVIEHLEARGAEVIVEALPVGDYLLSERVAVERKTASDFLASLTKKRLYRQLDALKENFALPVILIEGRELYGIRKIHPDVIRNTLALIVVNYCIPVIFTQDPRDTAGFLYAAACQEQLGRKQKISLRGEKKPMLLEERQRYLVESLPHIGPELAERLLRHFGSVDRIVCATEEELRAVPRIGAKKAREIRKVFTGLFSGRDPGAPGG